MERELRLREERIGELKDEIDESRELVREMEEHAQEHDEYLEMFITTFGLTLNDEGKWGNGEFITGYNALVAQYGDLRGRYNKLVRGVRCLCRDLGRQIRQGGRCLAKDRDALLAFYEFPAERWKHLRTTNVIESSFATVRHRTVRFRRDVFRIRLRSR